MLRFSCVAYRACLWRRRSLRFARHMTASLVASRFSCVADVSHILGQKSPWTLSVFAPLITLTALFFMARASLALACWLVPLAPSRLFRAARRHDNAMTRPSQYHVPHHALKQPPVWCGQSISRRWSHLEAAHTRRALSARCAPRTSRISCFYFYAYSDGDDDASTDAEAADVPDRVSSWGLEASLSLAVEAL